MTWLRGTLAASSGHGEARLFGAAQAIALADLATRTGLAEGLAELAGLAVLVRTQSQIGAAQALVELDGVARRIVLCPPDLADDYLPTVIETAGIKAIVTDIPEAENGLDRYGLPVYRLGEPTAPVALFPDQARATEWLMFTSGTTGVPKMVIHTLKGLTGAIKPRAEGAPVVVWGTFYDIRRYGGLQILLRALTGGASMVLSDAGEPVADFLTRLGERGVTNLSGTPSHWRRALMTPELTRIDPGYVRLSGEIADQAVLDSLRAFFPKAAVGHAYASTEAGVGFEVNDGLEGFPAAYVGQAGAEVEMKVVDGSLRIRSHRAASGYAGQDSALADAEGYVDTGDMVELRGDRYHFTGRRGGIINVGGLKVHPEEVEAVINRHPAVRMSRVSGRRNPITGALVTAEIVRADPEQRASDGDLKASILHSCRQALAAYKVPASVRFVDSLAVTAGGKLDRQHA
ncbi:MAG: fatty acid--CoA ligase family protein [Caulobacteraceae bacterium]|nr:fatty acid--CoA ligase family protein [Caulobacteraceae bacterium]